MTTLSLLAESPYLSLTTFKRDGTEVSTPVWLAPYGGGLCVITQASSGKAKRLRHTSRVLLAPCTARGVETGPRVEGRASLTTDDAGTDAVRDAIRARYGWQFRLFDLLGRLRGRGGDEVGVLVTVDET
jgi:hypothetical protein